MLFWVPAGIYRIARVMMRRARRRLFCLQSYYYRAAARGKCAHTPKQNACVVITLAASGIDNPMCINSQERERESMYVYKRKLE